MVSIMYALLVKALGTDAFQHLYSPQKLYSLQKIHMFIKKCTIYEVVGVAQVPLRMLSRSISVKPCARHCSCCY